MGNDVFQTGNQTSAVKGLSLLVLERFAVKLITDAGTAYWYIGKSDTVSEAVTPTYYIV